MMLTRQFFAAGAKMMASSRLQCVLMVLAAAWVALPGGARAEDAPQEVAADGTVSVVVNPPTARAGTEPDPVKVGAASQLLAKACTPLAAPLYDRPLPLMEALERSGDRSRRLWITQAYWKVSAGFALVHFSTEAVERLEFVAPGAEPHDRAVLDAAVAAARANLADARAELVVAQQELVDLVRLPAGEPLPWPVDRPLAAPYQTQFDTIFATRPATGRVRAINRVLPNKHEALEQRALAVAAAEEAFRMTEADHAKGRRPIEAVAAGQSMLVSQQREFCQALKAYNCDIAEYAMAVADLSVPHGPFAAMLIGTPLPWQPQPPAGGPSAIITTGATGEGIVAPPPGAFPADAGGPPSGPPPVFVPPPRLQPAIPATPIVPQLVP
jgi:hypothetical protein